MASLQQQLQQQDGTSRAVQQREQALQAEIKALEQQLGDATQRFESAKQQVWVHLICDMSFDTCIQLHLMCTVAVGQASVRMQVRRLQVGRQETGSRTAANPQDAA